jgi:UPF0755 protein
MPRPGKKLISIIVIPLVVVATASLLFFHFNTSTGVHKGPKLFTVHQGESVSHVATNLRNAGHIRSDRFFTLLVRLKRSSSRIKAGEYLVRPELRTTGIIEILTTGTVVTQRFTIPEGLHIRQIASLLQEQGVVSFDEFIQASQNKTILESYPIPFSSAEGFLFPDTYVVAKGLSSEQIVTIMIDRFFEELTYLEFEGYSDEELGKVVIIASLVEREAKIDSERPLIAAVFYNRLSKGKRLESCATVQYILGKTKERLLFSDLRVDSPYNTYLHRGLPPGPISNPGSKSIQAALFPADVDYLFFVSKRDGSHYFSTTYQEHLEAIEQYNQTGAVGHQIS